MMVMEYLLVLRTVMTMTSEGTFVEDCFDGQDNNCDGLADTEDQDCRTRVYR